MVIAGVLLAVGCDRNIESFQPGEKSSPPDLARIFPGPPPSAQTARDLSENGRAPDRAAMPPSRAEGSFVTADSTSQTSGAEAAAVIEGAIELPEEFASERPALAILFVIARQQGVERGPPLAVLRVAEPVFPYVFRIGPDDVMIPSMRFEGAISLSARLDADGNAMTRSPEDISSPVLHSLAPGATGIRLVLSDRG